MPSVPRLHVPVPLSADLTLALPPAAARHVQVLRLQPGAPLTLFDGRDGAEWTAEVLRMGRSEVEVRVGARSEADRELPRALRLLVGMPANERMDALVEKATELGAAALQPLQTERAVLRLTGERAERKREHWQAVAVSACEQCGRNRVPLVEPVRSLAEALALEGPAGEQRFVLSLRDDAQPARVALPATGDAPLAFLSGPEGGLSAAEEDLARRHGWQPLSLGPRTLRADTAPLAVLSWAAALA